MKANILRLLSIIFLFAAMLSCNNTNSDQKKTAVSSDSIVQSYPPKHDTSYSVKKEFMIAETTPVFGFFHEYGAVRAHYSSERIDWCARSKRFMLFDKEDHEIFTIGIEGCYLFASKKEYDSKGEMTKQYPLFVKSYNNYGPVEVYYASDSLLLEAIVPAARLRCTAIQDSLIQNAR